MNDFENKNRLFSMISIRNYLSIFFSGATLLLLFACNNKVENEIEENPKRTILFYIASDTNGLDNGWMGNEPQTKIDSIRKGWQPGKGEMLIYTDQTGRDACLLRINETKDDKGFYGLDTLDTFENDNSASPAVLTRVINQMKQDFPADSYGMIFFSHASGWLPKETLTRPRSLGIDNGEGTRQEMEFYDFAAAIPDDQFDFIIFEACLMADAAVMYELRNKADYVLASSAEIVAPGFAPIYTGAIMQLYNTRISAESNLKTFGQTYYNYIVTTFASDHYKNYRSATLSLIKLDEMESLASIVGDALQGIIPDENDLDASEIQTFDRPSAPGMGGRPYDRYFDLAHTVEQATSNLVYSKLETQLNKTVVWKAATETFMIIQYGFTIDHHCGLTTYIKRNEYPVMNAAYEATSWCKALRATQPHQE